MDFRNNNKQKYCRVPPIQGLQVTVAWGRGWTAEASNLNHIYDMVLSIFYILDGFIYLGGARGPPPKIQWPLVAQKLLDVGHEPYLSQRK